MRHFVNLESVCQRCFGVIYFFFFLHWGMLRRRQASSLNEHLDNFVYFAEFPLQFESQNQNFPQGILLFLLDLPE